MAEEKIYTLKELKKKLTEKERIFCHQYIIDWNGSRAARVAGYSEKSVNAIASQNLTKLYIQQYIDFIKDDIEKETGITKIRNLNELAKIAYSSIAHLHNTWIELKEFESLTDAQKEAIESTETKTEQKKVFDAKSIKEELVDIKYIKIKLHPKISAIQEINKMQGYHAAEKIDHEITDKRISKVNIHRK